MSLNTVVAAFALALMAVGGASPARAAGVVEVRFVMPERYSDIGRSAVDRERTLERIAKRLQGYGSRLPDGQILKVEMLDIDLAGELEWLRRHDELRVLRGGVDWPRMHLRWTLGASDGRTLQSGDERLKDMAYLTRTPRHGSIDGLAYDLRLLDEWFAQRFGAAAPH